MEYEVVFDIDEFRTLYPQFEKVTDEMLEKYFNAACLLCNNTQKSLVKDLDERKTLLYLLVCHIAELQGRGNTLVGLLTSATEGKVSVSVKPFDNANWYQQTQCGSLYWAATAKYRIGPRYFAYCPCKG